VLRVAIRHAAADQQQQAAAAASLAAASQGLPATPASLKDQITNPDHISIYNSRQLHHCMPPNHPSASPANFSRLHSFEIVHITGCALGEKATNDRHVIKAIPHSVEGKQQGEVALGTLQAGRTDQFALDFGISRTTGFRHTGKSSVWLSGYLTRSYASDFGSDEEYSMDDSEEDEEEEEESDSESDDEEAPAAVPLSINGVAVTAKVRHCEAFATCFEQQR
jgi:hypothetical protein